MEDPFGILGLRQDACVEEIRQAYRKLARKWHPDRFPPGPEREWADRKMCVINGAYAACIARSRSEKPSCSPDEEAAYQDVEALIHAQEYSAARQALLRIAEHGARWHYLFGVIFLRQGNPDKAGVYFGIAARKEPETALYRAAEKSIPTLQKKCRPSFWGRLFRKRKDATHHNAVHITRG